jgi:phosphotransferase system  glucose/maltose/N-acetylglucosamine-specific IIC component
MALFSWCILSAGLWFCCGIKRQERMAEFIQGASHVIIIGLVIVVVLAAGYVWAWIGELARRFSNWLNK